jgi:hypothetical protein
MSKTNWKLERHVDTVTVTFQADPLFAVSLDAGEIDDLLKYLGELRAMMKPAHLLNFKKDGDTNFSVDPRWEYDQETMLDQPVLRIRDPRFGWLHYVLTPDAAKRLGDALSQPIPQPKPPSSSLN